MPAAGSPVQYRAIRYTEPRTEAWGGWNIVSDVETAVAECVDWLNHRGPHSEIGSRLTERGHPPSITAHRALPSEPRRGGELRP